MMRAQTGPQVAVELRRLALTDETAFAAFVSTVSEGERRFLKEDIADPITAFRGFMGEGATPRLVAVNAADDLVGLAGAFPGEGWSSHVAEVRVLVSPSYRGKGVGRALAQAALNQVLELGCTHAYVEVIAEQEGLVAMFQDLGFLPEALLPDFVRDGAGEYHDLMLLTHRASEHWARTRVLGLDEVVG